MPKPWHITPYFLLVLQVPQLAALYHNDCCHVADQLLVLPYCYDPQLVHLAGQHVHFIAAARAVRAAGDACFDQLVRGQNPGPPGPEALGVLA